MKKITKIILVNILTLLFLLAIIDPFINNNFKDSLYLSKRSITLREHEIFKNKAYNRNKSGIFIEEQVKDGYLVRTDKNGFILGPKEETTEKPNIIFFGGSTTECLLVEEGSRFPYLVGKKLKTQNNKPIKTLNGGVGGNNSIHSLLNLVAKGIQLKPEMIVLMHNINDLGVLMKTGNYWVAPENRAIIKRKEEKELNIIEVTKSIVNFLYPNIYLRSRGIFHSLNAPKKELDEFKGFRQNEEIDFKLIEIEFEAATTAFIRMAQVYDIEVVLMTQARRLGTEEQMQMNTNKFATKETRVVVWEYHKKLNDKIREIANKENIFLIDLDKLISGKNDYFYDKVHLNTKGSQVVGQKIAEKLHKRYSYYRLED